MIRLQFDGYDLYDAVFKNHKKITLMWIGNDGTLTLIRDDGVGDCSITYVPTKLEYHGPRLDFGFEPIIIYQKNKRPKNEAVCTHVAIKFNDDHEVEFHMHCSYQKKFSCCGLEIKIV